jgi:pilus assembly protein CpaB
VIAALLAGGTLYIFYKRVSANSPLKPVSQIVVASADLPEGTTLSAKDVTLADWYSDVVPAGAFTKTDGVIGHPLLYPVSAKEPILQKGLGVEGAGIGLSGKIPEGMRAVAVRSNEIVGVAGFLYPGSHVDLLMTFTPPGANMPVTETVLQNAEVLTAGQTIEPDPQGKPQTVNVVTLLLTPEDSQKLQLASSQGNIQFVLRSGVDQKNVELKATRLDQLASAERPAVVPIKHAHKATPAPAPPVYLLEVIQGTQKTVQKF